VSVIPAILVMVDNRAVQGFCHLVSALGIAIFTPTILLTFGYTAINAILFTIPMSVCSVVWGVSMAIIADRFQHRSTLLLVSILIAVTGLTMAGWDTHRHVRLAGLFLCHMSLLHLFMFILILKRVLAHFLYLWDGLLLTLSAM
jgi:hypothetical protein